VTTGKPCRCMQSAVSKIKSRHGIVAVHRHRTRQQGMSGVKGSLHRKESIHVIDAHGKETGHIHERRASRHRAAEFHPVRRGIQCRRRDTEHRALRGLAPKRIDNAGNLAEDDPNGIRVLRGQAQDIQGQNEEES